ncbi:TPA: hypothetical protein ACH3X1_006683 [Trebouxia sp. C0004]
MPWGVIDVRECGAAGDDRTDDTDAVLQAIDRLPPSGGVLYFPPGQYILKQHLLIHDKPVTVRGEGVGLSRLIWPEDAASAGLVISQGARQDEQTDFTRVQHLSFYTRQRDVGEGLTINCEGQKADECGGIVVNRTNPRVFLDNLEFRGQNICLHGWWVCIKSRCAMHTVMSNIHMVGCTDWKSIGVLFEGGCGHVEIQLSQCWCFYCDHAVLVNDGLEGELLLPLPDHTNDPAGGCGHVEIQMSQCWCFCTDHAVLVNDGLEGEAPYLTCNKAFSSCLGCWHRAWSYSELFKIVETRL